MTDKEHKFTDKMCENLLDTLFPDRIDSLLSKSRNRLQILKDLKAPQVIIDKEIEYIVELEKRLSRIIGDKNVNNK